MSNKIKKKKKIKKIKKFGTSVEPVETNNTTLMQNSTAHDGEPQIIIPESLSSERMKSAFEKAKKEDELREKEKAAFQLPEGFKLGTIIEHGYYNLEDEVPLATKEFVFWQKYKPERHYELVRHGHYVTFLIYRPATDEEKAANRKKKRK